MKEGTMQFTRRSACGYESPNHTEAIMNIFDKIKDAIFGKAEASPSSAPPAARTSTPAPAATAAASSTQGQQQKAPQASPAPQPAGPVDIEAVLGKLQSQHSEKLNWRTSIVDLMKLRSEEHTSELQSLRH